VVTDIGRLQANDLYFPLFRNPPQVLPEDERHRGTGGIKQVTDERHGHGAVGEVTTGIDDGDRNAVGVLRALDHEHVGRHAEAAFNMFRDDGIDALWASALDRAIDGYPVLSLPPRLVVVDFVFLYSSIPGCWYIKELG
jgi:hypothetical protein